MASVILLVCCSKFMYRSFCNIFINFGKIVFPATLVGYLYGKNVKQTAGYCPDYTGSRLKQARPRMVETGWKIFHLHKNVTNQFIKKWLQSSDLIASSRLLSRLILIWIVPSWLQFKLYIFDTKSMLRRQLTSKSTKRAKSKPFQNRILKKKHT